MPATVATADDVEALQKQMELMQLRHEQELAEQRQLMADFIASLDDQVSTKKALELTGIESRTTLIAERQRPGTLLRFVQNGRNVTYSRASCLAHKRAHTRRTA